jgi:hypothetical protein
MMNTDECVFGASALLTNTANHPSIRLHSYAEEEE